MNPLLCLAFLAVEAVAGKPKDEAAQRMSRRLDRRHGDLLVPSKTIIWLSRYLVNTCGLEMMGTGLLLNFSGSTSTGISVE